MVHGGNKHLVRVYDKNRRPLTDGDGKLIRLTERKALERGEWLRVSCVWPFRVNPGLTDEQMDASSDPQIFYDSLQVLLQQRSQDDPICPGIWAPPSETLKDGEKYRPGGRRALQEELDVKDLELLMPSLLPSSKIVRVTQFTTPVYTANHHQKHFGCLLDLPDSELDRLKGAKDEFQDLRYWAWDQIKVPPVSVSIDHNYLEIMGEGMRFHYQKMRNEGSNPHVSGNNSASPTNSRPQRRRAI
jgi:ADP-ribose pyrophosphatase YjhB (NUDIX family)